MHVPSGEQMIIYDAAMRYKQEGTPLVVRAGKEYARLIARLCSQGHMRWRKGRDLRELRAHPSSNLIGMGVLPLQLRKARTRRRCA